MYGLSMRLAEGSPPVLHVRGELDMANAEEFGAALRAAMSADSTVVVDLAELTFIDVAGIRAIVQAAESRNGNGQLTLIHAPRVAWLFQVVGLEGISCIEFAADGDGHVG
jgi:anti-anti-sigma factor